MDSQTRNVDGESGLEPTGSYEPPRVERVLTPAELEREVLYAGAPATPTGA
jgi:hypothetical protein